MIVLSLFDGMSCGHIALQELGIPIEKYYLKDETVKNLLAYNDRNEKAGNGFRAKFHEGGGVGND